MAECNRCGNKSAIAREWGVCTDCFQDDVDDFIEKERQRD